MNSRYINTILILIVATVFSVCFIDRSLALWIYSQHFNTRGFIHLISEGLPYFVFVIMLIILALSRSISLPKVRVLSFQIQRFALLLWFILCLELSTLVKTVLKVIFGRYWPATWTNHNLSLLHDQVYGFNWLHGFANQGSFPSGHSTFIAYCCGLLILVQPKLTILWISIILLVVFALVIQNYHFLGDCLAGVSLGMLCAYLAWRSFNSVCNGQIKP